MDLEKMTHETHWTIEKRKVGETEPYAVESFDGNLLLNEGINNLWDLSKGSGTAYDNTNTYIGVGDSSTAAAATQTGLQAATNKDWAAMEATYPTTGSSQQSVYRAVFADGHAEFAWEEFTVGCSSDDSGANLNRKVSSKGTKASGEAWTITCTITLS